MIDVHRSVSDQAPVAGPEGALANGSAVEHLQRLTRRFYAVGENAWCLVGNGLSNQTFVRGPEGIIAIDTGESIAEMQVALAVEVMRLGAAGRRTCRPVRAGRSFRPRHWGRRWFGVAERPGGRVFAQRAAN